GVCAYRKYHRVRIVTESKTSRSIFPSRVVTMSERLKLRRYRYFVAHVAQISRGNAQAIAVNSTDLVWSRLVRDQEVGGSNPLAPTNPFATSNLWNVRPLGKRPGGRSFHPIEPAAPTRFHLVLH